MNIGCAPSSAGSPDSAASCRLQFLMQSGRRILFLAADAYGGNGGIATFNREFLQALASVPEVTEITVLPRLAFHANDVPPAKVKVDTAGLGGAANYVSAVLRRSLPRPRYDLVHCGHINLAPLAIAAARLHRAPATLSVHGIDAWDRHPRITVRVALSHFKRIVSVSRKTKERFENWSGLSGLQIIPNTVHLESFGIRPRREDLVERWELGGKKVLMTLGRLVGQERAKGFDEVLDVLPRLAVQYPNLVYMICGDGPDKQRLAAKAKELGIASRVRFTGFIAEHEKSDLYQLADVFVMPSRGEGFGIVLLEALACGVPAIGSTTDGTRDALLDGELGRLVDPDQPDELIAAIGASFLEPRQVPKALQHYAFTRFEERVHEFADAVMSDLK